MSAADTTIPSFLGPVSVVEIPKKPRADYPWHPGWWRARLNPNSGELRRPFTLPRQHMQNWCWASVGIGMHEFNTGERRRQCELAQKVRDPIGVNCCQNPSHSDCDSIEDISRVLDAIDIRSR